LYLRRMFNRVALRRDHANGRPKTTFNNQLGHHRTHHIIYALFFANYITDANTDK
jgi:hypothetical protein